MLGDISRSESRVSALTCGNRPISQADGLPFVLFSSSLSHSMMPNLSGIETAKWWDGKEGRSVGRSW